MCSITLARSGLFAVFLALATPGWFPGAVSAQEMSLAAAVNLAGRQRMLAQRIVKAYCLAGLGNEQRDARQQRFNAIVLFEEIHAQLLAFAESDAAFDALVAAQESWARFDEIASGEVTREGARRLLPLGGELLQASDAVVAAIRGPGEHASLWLLDRAGRQRMLTQRMVQFYLALAWGLGGTELERELDAARDEFEAVLSALRAAPDNTPELGRMLDEAAEEWRWLDSSLVLRGPELYFPDVVDDAAEKMLIVTERIVQRYESLLEERSDTARKGGG
jgi:hypothetical protein